MVCSFPSPDLVIAVRTNGLPYGKTDMTSSQLSAFFGGSHVTKVYLKIEDKPPEALPIVTLQDKRKLDRFPEPSHLVELHPVFSHINFLLIETLSVTQHGEFITNSKQGKYETIVELGGHISQRYCLSKEELKEVQQIYNQILDAWIGWKLCQKKTDM